MVTEAIASIAPRCIALFFHFFPGLTTSEVTSCAAPWLIAGTALSLIHLNSTYKIVNWSNSRRIPLFTARLPAYCPPACPATNHAATAMRSQLIISCKTVF